MSLLPLTGHRALRERLADAMDRGALPASLLFAGPPGVGKQRLALWLGQRLLCASPAADERPCGRCQSCRYALEGAHPDLHWIFPRPRLKDSDADASDVRADYADAIRERMDANGLYPPPGGNEGIYVATIRAVVLAAAMSPSLGSRKAFVIGDAERMVSQEGSDQAANAFLKMLEEPPADTTIILTSSEPGSLLPTIRSRVITVRVAPLADDEVREFVKTDLVANRLSTEGIKGTADELARLAAGAPGRLFAGESLDAAFAQAKRLLDAATARDRAAAYRAAFALGAAGARGKFTDTLDALTVILRDQARAAVQASGDERALGLAKAVQVVEGAKERAYGNVNPQLIGAGLMRQLRALLT